MCLFHWLKSSDKWSLWWGYNFQISVLCIVLQSSLISNCSSSIFDYITKNSYSIPMWLLIFGWWKHVNHSGVPHCTPLECEHWESRNLPNVDNTSASTCCCHSEAEFTLPLSCNKSLKLLFPLHLNLQFSSRLWLIYLYRVAVIYKFCYISAHLYRFIYLMPPNMFVLYLL